MKFRVTLKDPDTLGDACLEAATDAVKNIEGLSDDERATLAESRREALQEFASKWFEYGEYVTLELDTDAGTAVVVPRE